MTVGEAAKLVGVSVRTLHYYDELGLLRPSGATKAGYRLYDKSDIERLEQILFYRELGLKLADIKLILSRPDYDSRQALERHRELLMLKKRRIDEMISLVGEILEGKTVSKPKITEDDIRKIKKQYADEVRERWGDTEAYRESEKKSDAELVSAAGEADKIFKAFASARFGDPDGPEALSLVRRWQEHITDNYYKCTKQILSGLGEMYSYDERFRENIDRYGEGTAAFMSAAIKAYCGE
ncbi:MAG: MerR family transcriptional regulator [Oscillospiraceae bacterium]|jgi:DNA-binding transcriptional MerR regulator